LLRGQRTAYRRGGISYPESEVIETLARLASAGGVRALAAIAALGSTGDKRAVPHLLAVLEQTQDQKQRGAAVVALGMIGDSAAAPALLGIVETERDEGMRIRAVAALASIESGSPVRALIELLDDPSPQIQLYAIRGLRRSGAEEAGPPLAAYAEKINVRLGQDVKSGWKRPAYGVLQDLSLVEASLRAIADLDPESGTRAMLKTAALGRPPSGRPDSLKVAEGVYRARRRALYGLGYTGSADALALLLGEWGLGDTDPRLRAVAVRSLGVLGDPEAVSALESALLDPVPEVRWTAARVLGLMRASDATTELVDSLEDGNRQVRIEASTALGLVGAEQATDKLMRVAEQDPEESVRIAARLALERLDEF